MSQQSHQKEPTGGSIRVGLFVPGVLAFGIENAAQDKKGVENVVDYVRAIESQLSVRCCGGQQPVVIFSRGEIEELYQRAQDSPYDTLVNEVEKTYSAFSAICPICGRSGTLPLKV